MSEIIAIAIMGSVTVICITVLALLTVWQMLITNKRLTNAVMARDNQEYKDLNQHDLRLVSQKKQANERIPDSDLIPLSEMSDEDIVKLAGYDE